MLIYLHIVRNSFTCSEQLKLSQFVFILRPNHHLELLQICAVYINARLILQPLIFCEVIRCTILCHLMHKVRSKHFMCGKCWMLHKCIFFWRSCRRLREPWDLAIWLSRSYISSIESGGIVVSGVEAFASGRSGHVHPFTVDLNHFSERAKLLAKLMIEYKLSVTRWVQESWMGIYIPFRVDCFEYCHSIKQSPKHD